MAAIAQQQSFQQAPLFQSPLPIQQQLTQIQQPANQLSSLPVLQSLPYQNPPQLQAYVPVQEVPESVSGQSRQSIPGVSQYAAQDEYPYRRHHHRSSRRHYRPYEPYRSFEDTYGKSPGIFDDLKDISKYE